jgi:formylmethanofuran dehydrogenase subunit E
MTSKSLQEFLNESASHHTHLCPRQVIGVRMGLLAGQILRLELPQSKKRLLAIIETDGCFADGISTVTGCTVGHRTLHVEDIGKTAAVFVDTQSGNTIRISPVLDIRQCADTYAPESETRRYFAQLHGYQVIPDDEMFNVEQVVINTTIEAIVSRPGVRVNCNLCGEEIINEREIKRDDLILCRTCAGQAYYQTAKQNSIFSYPHHEEAEL